MMILHTILLPTVFLASTWSVTQGRPHHNPQQRSRPSSPQELPVVAAVSSRDMQQDDFAELNAILSDVVVEVPENPPSFSSGGITMDLYNIVCRDFRLGDAALSSRRVDSRSVELQVTLSQLDFACSSRYNYRGALGVGGRGDVTVATRGNQAVVTATLGSGGDPTVPPTDVVMDSCVPTIEIVDIDFANGGVISWVLDAIEGMLRSTMERLAEETVCRELEAALQGQTKDFLAFARDTLDKYSDADARISDDKLLAREQEVEESASVRLLNLQQQETEVGQWMHQLLGEGAKYFNALVDAPSGGTELQVNQLLREYVLDATGALILDRPEGGLLVFEGHDILTQTTIALERVKLVGLDSLTRFDPFTVMDGGNYTLQTFLAWEYLGLEVDATVTIRPSTRPDSIVVDADNSVQPVIESVNGFVGVRDLVANASLLTAIDQTALENLRLGSLLSTDNAMNCLLSTFHALEWTSMTVEAADVLTPSLSGLVSPGIDRVLSSAIDAAFLMYEANMLKGAPSYFQQEMRPMLNQRLLNDFFLGGRVESDDWGCPPLMSWSRNGSVDFRDLLLPPDEARVLGGTGQEQYGDFFSGVVMPYLRRQVLDTPSLNTNVIRPLTVQQSGEEGTLVFRDVYEYQRQNSTLFDFFTFKISKVTISNLDTVVDPVQLLNPTSGNTLLNQLSFGGGTIRNSGESQALNLTMRVFLEIGGEESPISMKNEVDFSIAIPSASLSVGVLANFNERNFLEFPLDDITNPYCWLAAIERSDTPAEDPGREAGDGILGNSGVIGTANDEYGQPPVRLPHNLALSFLSLTVSTLFMDSVCVQSSSPACDSIDGVIQRLRQAGLVSLFREPIVALVEEALRFLWDDLNVQGLLAIAPTYCPHSDQYDPQKSAPEQRLPTVSALSTNSSETVIALGVIAMEAAIVVSAKNQVLSVSQDPQESKTSSAFPEGNDILDWENLSERWGAWVDVVFEEVRSYIATPVDAKKEIRSKRAPGLTPRANILLRNYVLNNAGEMVIDLGLSAAALGFTISAAQARIRGLDTITAIDPLLVIDSYTLKTTVRLDELTIVIDIDVSTLLGAAERIHLAYTARDIMLDVNVAVALNTTTFGKTQLGSIFDLSDVDSCLIKGIQALEVSMVNFSASEFDPPSIHGFFSEQRKEAVSLLLNTLHAEYQSDIIEAVPLLLNTTVRESINAFIPQMLEDFSSRCPLPPVFEENGLIDFRELLLSEVSSERLSGSGTSTYGNLFSLVYDMLDKEVMQTGADGRPHLSGLIGRMTEKQSNTSGTIRVAGMVVDYETTLQAAGLHAVIGVQVSNVLIRNLDSIGDPLRIFQPVDSQPTLLNNTLSFGVESKPLVFAGTITLSLSDGAEMNIRNEVNVSLMVEDVSLQIAFLVQILENSISNFPFEDFSDWRCWLSTILLSSSDVGGFGGMEIKEQNYGIGNFSMDISCNSCTSPEFDDLLMSLYAPSDLSIAIQEQASSLMEAGFLQGGLEALIFDSKRRCPHHPNYDAEFVSQTEDEPSLLSSPAINFSSSEEKPIYFNVANAFIAVILCIVGVVGKVVVARRNKKWMNSLSQEGKFFFLRQQEKQDTLSKWLDDNTTSLALSPFIPRPVRWGVPIALVANIGLFMEGHLGVLSVVNLEAMLAGESFTIHKFMVFSFFDSTRTTYQNGGAEMVVLIWIFMGVWPYVKLLLSLFVWVAPTTCIGVKRRGVVLIWIDALAKLSVVDIFTMLVGVAVLLVYIGGPDESITSDGVYYALKAVVIPKAGCYCLLIAQRLSRVSSRFLLEYHDNVVSSATREREEKEGDMSVSQINFDALSSSTPRESKAEIEVSSNDESDGSAANETGDLEDLPCDDVQNSDQSLYRESMAQTTHSESSRSSLSMLKDYRWGYWGVVFGFIAIILIFAIGCIFAPAIAFDLSAIGGLALESEKTLEEAVSEYGAFIVMSGILVRASFVLNSKIDYIGLGLLLSAVGISVSLIFMVQTYQFIKRKLNEWRKRRLHPETPSYGHDGCGLPFYFRLFKWHHMEIYLISFAIGVWQLGSIASYSMYLYCDLMTRTYDVLTFLGIAEASTSQCFNEQASNGGNLIIVLFSFLILSMSFFFEARAQYKKNVQNCLNEIDEKDIPRFSLAWSSDMSKNSRYSHLTDSLSLRNTESFRSLFAPPSSPGLSIPGSGGSGGSIQSPVDRCMPQHPEAGDEPSTPVTSHNEDPTSFPIATPCSVACSSRHSDRSSVIDANCEVAVTPPLVVQPWAEAWEEDASRDDTDAPPLMPSWSLEEDPPEVSSLDVPSPASPSSPPPPSPSRLSFLFDHFPIGPRRSLPPPTTATAAAVATTNIGLDPEEGGGDGGVPSPSKPRRVRSTDDFLHYMEDNPHQFS